MKESVILCEFSPCRGHRMLFDKIYSVLEKKYNVIAFVPKCVENDNYYKLERGYYYNKSNIIINNISCISYVLSNVRTIIRYAKHNNINKVLCLTYDDISMFFASMLIPKRIKIFLMHHHNIDLLSKSSIKRLFFKLYSSRYKHIVLCEFIKKYVRDSLGVESSLIYVWPHPSYQTAKLPVIQDIDCVGLSGSNDDELISKLIEDEKKNGVLKKNNLRVILKSHLYNFDNEYLKVFTGYLDRHVYDDYIQRARSIFIAFPSDFKYRMSATLMDSLCNNKIVIGTDIPVIVNCKKRYPDIIKLYSSNDFVSSLVAIRETPIAKSEFEEFKNNHADDYIFNIYTATLDGASGDAINMCDF